MMFHGDVSTYVWYSWRNTVLSFRIEIMLTCRQNSSTIFLNRCRAEIKRDSSMCCEEVEKKYQALNEVITETQRIKEELDCKKKVSYIF